MSVSPSKHALQSSTRLIATYSPCTNGVVINSVFFALFFLYAWIIVEPRLIYHGAGTITNFPVFFKTWDFLKTTVCERPGGPIEYTCALLAQLFYFNWTGALIITAQALLLTWCTGYLLKSSAVRNHSYLRYLPTMLLLPIYGRYTYHFSILTAMCAASAFACFYVRVHRSEQKQATAFSLVAYLVLSVILYTLAGGAYLLFVLLCAIYELLYQRRYLIGALYVLAGVAFPYVLGVMLFGVSIIDAYCDQLAISWKVIAYKSRRECVEYVYLLYLFLPVSMILWALWHLLKPRPVGSKSESQIQKPKMRRNLTSAFRKVIARYKTAHRLKYITASVLLIGIGTTIALLSFDSMRKTIIEIDYYSTNRMWPEVLRTARRFCEDPIIISAVNRALYHTGRLGYDLCAWPQHPDTLLLTAEEYKNAYWKRFDVRLDLGLLNMAENDLTECLEIFGPRPLILNRLALINMAKGNNDSAKIYLGALSKTLFEAEWANHYLTQLRIDPNLTSDKYIQLLRTNQLKDDQIASGGFQPKPQVLSLLLQSNHQNRMAFEYLAAWFLLTRKLDRFIEHLARINDFDYPQIPPLYEEAILIYMSRTNKPVDLGGRRGSDRSRQRMDSFAQTFNRYGQNKVAAFRELVRDFGDSYYFYYLYGFSGVKL